MNEKLNDAMNEIRDEYIADAAKPKRRLPKWFGAVAAMLAVVLLVSMIVPSLSLQAAAVVQAEYPEYEYVGIDRDVSLIMRDFYKNSMATTLSNLCGQNGAYSPLNLAIALSVMAELTTGEAQQQILTALNAPDMATLRIRANTLWRASYYDKNNQTLLANSLWLDNSMEYNQAVMDTLASNYYTSVYHGNLGSSKVNRLIAQWLDRQTGNMLKQDTSGIHLPEDTVLALYSTIYFQAKWRNEFSAANNKSGIFHSPDGDVTVTYMNKTRTTGIYYWADDFGAIYLPLKDGSKMWLFLPDEGKSVEDILVSGDYLDMLNHETENQKEVFINLSLPKFDIRQNSDLRADLEKIGITDVFDPSANAFANSVYSHKNGSDVYLTSANQATRVAIDEKGVTAASYIEFPGAGAAEPPDDEIDFILDRPFFFIVAKGSLPLFAGVVNQP